MRKFMSSKNEVGNNCEDHAIVLLLSFQTSLLMIMSILRYFFTCIFRFINILLPFTRPGTPLLQDIAHTALVCALLYYAPRYFERQQQRQGLKGQEAHSTNDVKKTSSESRANDGAEEHADNHTRNHESNINNGNDLLPREEVETDSDHDDLDDETNMEAFPGVPNQHLPEADNPHHNANPQQQQNLPNPRVVSTKKARSIARRSQRRAYNEFLRSQGDAARAAAASEATQHEASASLERARRSAADAAAELRLSEERQARKELALAKAAKDESRTQMVVTIVKKRLLDVGLVDIEKDVLEFVDELNVEKVEKIIRAAGIERTRLEDKQMVSTIILKSKYIVNLDEDLMREVYNVAATRTDQDLGKVTWAQLGSILESLIMMRSKDKSLLTSSQKVSSPSIMQSLRVAVRT